MGPLHTLILGAGAAGLAAAYRLALAGARPIVVEASDRAGGLMRSIRRHGFQVDVGRKELYTRIPEVDELWSEILGDDYRAYDHRVGVLYRGTILERSSRFRGPLRGMPLRLLAPAVLDLLLQKLRNPFLPAPSNEEEYWHRTRGERFSRMLSQGYHEKFSGRLWRDRPPPCGDRGTHRVLARAFAGEAPSDRWRHPVKGSGQIVERLEELALAAGAEIRLKSQVVAIDSDDRRIRAVTVARGEETITFRPEHVVSSLPLGRLGRMIGLDVPPAAAPSEARTTVLVYLFLDEPPRFDHAWLDVTCPEMEAGRITNYAGFGGEMVPHGMTCLAAEYFLTADDPRLALDDGQWREKTIRELAAAELIDPARCFDQMVLELRGTHAAASFRDWRAREVQAVLRQLRPRRNLFDVNRAGTDVATQAGLEAAQAILREDRSSFDERADPARPPAT